MDSIFKNILLIFLTLLGPKIAFSAEPTTHNQIDPKFRIGVTTGLHTLQMKEWNDQWRAWATPGEKAPQLDAAISVGADITYLFLPDADIGIEFNFFNSQMGTKYTFDGGFFTYEETETYTFPLVWIGPCMSYQLIPKGKNLGIHVRWSVGYIALSGANLQGKGTTDFLGTVSEDVWHSDFSGHGFGLGLITGAIWQVNSRLAGFFDVGYKSAKISTIEANSTYTPAGGNAVTNSGKLMKSSGGEMPLDFSGWDFRFGGTIGF